jgi:hypothetical protein
MSLTGILLAVFRIAATKNGRKIISNFQNYKAADEFFFYYDKYRIWRGVESKILKNFGRQTEEIELSWIDKLILKRLIAGSPSGKARVS